MEILNRIIGELKDVIQYFKQITKNKYYGDRFEEWGIKNSNISKREHKECTANKTTQLAGYKHKDTYKCLLYIPSKDKYTPL